MWQRKSVFATVSGGATQPLKVFLQCTNMKKFTIEECSQVVFVFIVAELQRHSVKRISWCLAGPADTLTF
jgi:hypothetical protein